MSRQGRVRGTTLSPRFGLWIALLVLAGGCASSDALRVREVQTKEGIEARAADFWEVSNVHRTGKARPRIAVLDFSLQFVPSGTRGKLDSDVGVGLQLELPGVLYGVFLDVLGEFGVDPVPHAEVSDAASFAQLDGVELVEIEPISASGDAEADRARLAEMWFPVDGLLAITEAPSEVEARVREILAETRADMALIIHARLSKQGGKLAVEEGTQIWAFTPERFGSLTAQRALVSEVAIVDRESGMVKAVSSPAYVEAARNLFRPMLSMALVRIR